MRFCFDKTFSIIFVVPVGVAKMNPLVGKEDIFEERNYWYLPDIYFFLGVFL